MVGAALRGAGNQPALRIYRKRTVSLRELRSSLRGSIVLPPRSLYNRVQPFGDAAGARFSAVVEQTSTLCRFDTGLVSLTFRKSRPNRATAAILRLISAAFGQNRNA